MPCLQKLQAAAAAAEEERFQQHLAQVTDALQQRSGVLGEVDALLEAQAQVKARQQRQMYEQWSQQVFDQIQVGGGITTVHQGRQVQCWGWGRL
jgi:hypothetical protein